MLERGFIFTSMLLTAMTAAMIDRELLRSAAWALVGAVLSWFGIIHAWKLVPGGIASPFGWGMVPRVSAGYLMVAALFGFFSKRTFSSGSPSKDT